MIGIFDSGIGGLTVVKKIFKSLPEYQILYFGDTARCPYGSRGETIIKKYAMEDADFLIEHGAKIIVVACNTVSAIAIDDLKRKLSLPIFGVVMPAVRKAVQITSGRIGIIATRATINSGIYGKLIKNANPKIKVFFQSAPLLVPLVEENWIKKTETRRIIKRYLSPLKANKIDTLILACTHYPFLRKIIQNKIGRKVKIVDPAEETAKELKKFLEKNSKIKKSLNKNSFHKFYVSDLTPQSRQLAGKLLGKKIKLEEKRI